MGDCLARMSPKGRQRLSVTDEDKPLTNINYDRGSHDAFENKFKSANHDMYKDFHRLSIKMDRQRGLSQPEMQHLRRSTRKMSLSIQASVDPERLSLPTMKLDTTKMLNLTRKKTLEKPKRRYNVWFCNSFDQYLEYRDTLIEPYEVRLENYNPNWKIEGEWMIAQLKEMDCSKQWVAVEHIGSTAVVGLHAKPILDMMITIESADMFDNVIENFLRDQANSRLPFKIAFKSKAPFTNDDWGFIQIPKYAASGKQMSEVNVHIYVDRTYSAHMKIIFRDYLNENEKSRNEYKNVKLELMKQIDEKKLSIALYAKKKSAIVKKILRRASLVYPLKEYPANQLANPDVRFTK